jgi:bisphosphoglycerate-dependent phosphoglycerate mutase
LEKFPQYRLEDLTRKSFFQGGLVPKQFTTLLNCAIKNENTRNRFYANIHGVKIKNHDAGRGNEKVIDIRSIYNGDPKSVQHLSQDEREQMTRDLMEKMRGSMPGGLGN